jgi:hypothetical protein
MGSAMLAAIFSQIGMSIINGILGNALEAFKAYENKQISVEQLKDQLYGLMMSAIKDIEVAQADALAKTYASFMGAVVQSKTLQRVWAFVVISQSMMLLWFQFGIPLIVALGIVWRWPPSGDTAQWAYLLVGACLGMGPMVLRSGPAGPGGLAGSLKAMIGK